MFIRPSKFVEIINLKNIIIIKDYFTGKVFAVENSPQKNILKDALSGVEIEKLIVEYKDDFYLFWNELIQLELIELSETLTYYNDEMSFGGIIPKFYSNNHKKDIRNIVINIGGVCENGCTFCNKEVEKECLACSYDPNKNRPSYDLNILKNFLLDIVEYNNRITNITFLGVVNSENMNIIIDVVDFLKNKQISFSIITPEFKLSNDIAQLLKSNSFLIYLQFINRDTMNFYNMLSEEQKVIPILRMNDSYIVDEFNRRGIDYIQNYEVDELIKNNKFRGNNRYFLDNPSFEFNVIGYAGLKCLFGRIYIDCAGGIHACKLYECIGNIGCNESTIWNNLWREYTNHHKDVDSCIHCEYRNNCSVCAYYNKKYSFLKCNHNTYDMMPNIK